MLLRQFAVSVSHVTCVFDSDPSRSQIYRTKEATATRRRDHAKGLGRQRVRTVMLQSSRRFLLTSNSRHRHPYKYADMALKKIERKPLKESRGLKKIEAGGIAKRRLLNSALDFVQNEQDDLRPALG
jgi:hypothetical protein